ncbi:hypothetical protein HDU93_001053 [Gonapodya sp. JEL0774]|nr:hypothetical protein HDU93_001053 [Gonapodya sp. JEL0774]
MSTTNVKSTDLLKVLKLTMPMNVGIADYKQWKDAGVASGTGGLSSSWVAVEPVIYSTADTTTPKLNKSVRLALLMTTDILICDRTDTGVLATGKTTNEYDNEFQKKYKEYKVMGREPDARTVTLVYLDGIHDAYLPVYNKYAFDNTIDLNKVKTAMHIRETKVTADASANFASKTKTRPPTSSQQPRHSLRLDDEEDKFPRVKDFDVSKHAEVSSLPSIQCVADDDSDDEDDPPPRRISRSMSGPQAPPPPSKPKPTSGIDREPTDTPTKIGALDKGKHPVFHLNVTQTKSITSGGPIIRVQPSRNVKTDAPVVAIKPAKPVTSSVPVVKIEQGSALDDIVVQGERSNISDDIVIPDGDSHVEQGKRLQNSDVDANPKVKSPDFTMDDEEELTDFQREVLEQSPDNLEDPFYNLPPYINVADNHEWVLLQAQDRVPTPNHYKEAIILEHKEYWHCAMRNEFDQLNEFGTWTLAPIESVTKGHPILTAKRVFAAKDLDNDNVRSKRVGAHADSHNK